MSRILVTEDEASILRILEFRFKSLGHEIILAANGAEAVELASRESRI